MYFDLKTSPTVAVAARRGAAAHEAATELPSVGQRASPRTYSTRRVQRLPDQALLDLLERQGVEFGSSVASVSSMASRGLLTVFALWLPLVPLFLVMRRITGTRLLRRGRVSRVSDVGFTRYTALNARVSDAVGWRPRYAQGGEEQAARGRPGDHV
jgi:hypothetical protein